jgi:hypothetical protein
MATDPLGGVRHAVIHRQDAQAVGNTRAKAFTKS